MRRILAANFAATLMLSLAACGNSANDPLEESISQSEATQSQKQTSEPEETAPPESEQEEEDTTSKILIAYFSWAENALWKEDVDAVTSLSVIVPGNVQQSAGWVQGRQAEIRSRSRWWSPSPATGMIVWSRRTGNAGTMHNPSW